MSRSNRDSASPSPEVDSQSTQKEREENTSQSPEASSSSKSHSPEPQLKHERVSTDAPPAVSSSAPTEGDASTSQLPVVGTHSQGDWQAIWSPQHNAYYFYNARTNETTWTNPLAESSSASQPSSSAYNAEEAAIAQGIDPSLAYLDPSLAAGPSNPAAFTYSAKFNARTGAFTRPDARNPDHVSDYERMRRMNNMYFDMDAWQNEIDQGQEEEGGKKRKKPTKKDLVSPLLATC